MVTDDYLKELYGTSVAQYKVPNCSLSNEVVNNGNDLRQ